MTPVTITLNIDGSNPGLMQALGVAAAPEIARELLRQMREQGLVLAPPPPDALVEVSEIRYLLGRNGKARSYGYFKRNFLDTGLLKLVENPSNRSKQYVLREDAMNVLKGAKIIPVVKLGKID